LNSVDATNQNRSLGGEQLDDGIVDTLVSALLLMNACHISSYLQTEPQHFADGTENTASLREFGLVSAISDSLGLQAEMRVPRDRYALLSQRERQVMVLVVSGLLNKQVGGELGISEIMVKAPRQGDAEDEDRFSCRPGENDREAPRSPNTKVSPIPSSN
jgi:hypothetical protein